MCRSYRILNPVTDFASLTSSGSSFRFCTVLIVKELDLNSLFVLGLYNTSTLLISSPSSILVFVLVGLDSSRLRRSNQSSLQTLLNPLITLKTSMRSPLTLLSHRLLSPASFNLSSYDVPLTSDMAFSARCCTFSIASASFSNHGLHAATANSIFGLTNVL